MVLAAILEEPAPKANRLYYYANYYRKFPTEEDKLEKINATDLLDYELEQMIKNGELIIIQLNAKVRLGKTTAAFAIAQNKICPLLKQYGINNIKFGMKNIARDQQEYAQMMSDPNLCNTVIVIDEENELEETGENVTAEQALAKTFSDVQAARYVHRIYCSPKEITDTNADIILDVVAIDKQTKTTRCKLYYKYHEGTLEYTQLLGYVDINVANVIKTWEKVRPTFYKTKKTQQDHQIIAEAAQKDWYTYYVVKKHEKMELITKHHIFRPRILRYAEAIQLVIKKLRKISQYSPQSLNPSLIKNYTKLAFRAYNIPQSIIGNQLATQEAEGVLSTWKNYYQTCRDLGKLQKKITTKEQQETAQEMQAACEELKKAAETQEQELQEYAQINQQYHTKEAKEDENTTPKAKRTKKQPET